MLAAVDSPVDFEDEEEDEEEEEERGMIYLDYNATTPLCDEARAAMGPYLDDILEIHRACMRRDVRPARLLMMHVINLLRFCALNRTN